MAVQSDMLSFGMSATWGFHHQGAATATGEGVFNNVKAKWSTVLRRPQRLPVLRATTFLSYRDSDSIQSLAPMIRAIITVITYC
eukprot:scaffold112929_cov17-Prasinocladus_malaysianus.AAC.1